MTETYEHKMIGPAPVPKVKRMIGEIDKALWDKDWVIIGVDEVGRGPIAGPTTAGAVLMAGDIGIKGINDSKKVSAKRREALSEQLKNNCSWHVHHVSHTEIDEIGLNEAIFTAMRVCVTTLVERWLKLSRADPKQLVVLVDGPHQIPKLPFRQRAVVDGDALSLVVAAASIVAKVDRDALMVEYDKQYPQYGFAKHKGYGTKEHVAAIEQYGPCPIHRHSVRTIRKKDRHEEWVKAKGQNASWHTLQKLGGYE